MTTPTPDLAAVVAELEALEKAATPGPWAAVCPRVRWRIMAGERYVMESGDDEVRTEADAAFIAALRNHAPALLDAARERDEWEEGYERRGRMLEQYKLHRDSLARELVAVRAERDRLAEENYHLKEGR